MAFRCFLGASDWTEGAAATATSELPALPVSNLLLDQPRERYQALSGVTDVEINVTRAVESEITYVAALFANIHNQHASWRLRIAHVGEIADPWLDTARIFGGAGAPHLYALRFVDSDASAGGTTSFTMTGSYLVEAVVRVFTGAASYTIFRQIAATEPHFYLDADRHLCFDYGATHVETAEALEDFVWTHVAVKHDDTANTITLYMNGTPVEVLTSAAGPFGGASTSDYVLGGPGIDIAEFRGWTTARADADILADAFDPIADQAGLATYLKLDAGSGTTLADSHSGGPGATQANCIWIWPNRFWDSPDLDGFDRTHALWCAPALGELGGMAGHVRIDIRDELMDESSLSIGTLAIGAGRQPAINLIQGSTPFGVADFGSRTTDANGVTHLASGAASGQRQLVFESRSQDELYQFWHRFVYGVRNSRPVFFCSDVTDIYYRFQRSAWGVFDGPLTFTENKGPQFRMRTTLRELG